MNGLGDVKAGDLVVVNGRGDPHTEAVTAVTRTQIILPPKRRFRKDNGRAIGDASRWSRERISVDPSDFAEARRDSARKAIQRGYSLNQSGVVQGRAMLDELEASLRECGEWKDEP